MSRRLCKNTRISSLLVAALTTAALGWSAANAQTPDQALAPERMLAQLERDFWACDYASTVMLLDSGTAMACSEISEKFKQLMFKGDFPALHAYWLQNKAARYRALAAGWQDAFDGRVAAAER